MIPKDVFQDKLVDFDDMCILDSHLHSERIVACMPKHIAIFTAIQVVISRLHFQFSNKQSKLTYEEETKILSELKKQFDEKGSKSYDDGRKPKRYAVSNWVDRSGRDMSEIESQNITWIEGDDYISEVSATTELRKVFPEHTSSTEEKCMDFSDNSHHVDINLLLDIVKNNSSGNSCHGDETLSPFMDHFDPHSITDRRKVPRIVHMTSKSRCLTQGYHENLNKWRIQGHSIFLHDDDAVEKLLNRSWPEVSGQNLLPPLMNLSPCSDL